MPSERQLPDAKQPPAHAPAAGLSAIPKRDAGDRHAYWQRWNVDNLQAIGAYNRHIADEGLPLSRYRTF